MLDRIFTRIASIASSWAGKPSAFIIASATIIIWATTGRLFDYSDTWQLVINTSTTIITFLMVFVIQNSQNRDAAALQAKLDELIRASQHARNDFIGIEHRTDAEVEAIRRALETEVAKVDSNGRDRHESHAAVTRLLKRI
ncbi:MAG: low affinity iron permease family protein [Sphingopyxis sp.]